MNEDLITPVISPQRHYWELYDMKDINGDPIKWTSVTKILGYLKQPFDADAAAEKASKNKKGKWYGMSIEEIKDAWSKEAKRSTDLGDWYHKKQEKFLIDSGEVNGLKVFTPEVVEGFRKLPEQKLNDGIYPEHMVYLKSAQMNGIVDLITVKDGIVSIDDYKTNKEIKSEGFKSWDGSVQKMLSPINHLDDCNLNHYTLQLGFYMYMILKQNPKLKPGKLTIQHILFELEDEKDQYGFPIVRLDESLNPIVKDIVKYDVPYLKSEILSIVSNKSTILSNIYS